MRMRVAATAVVLTFSVFGLAGQARAVTPQVWQGTAFISGFTTPAAKEACTAANAASTGDDYVLVYRPIIAGSTTNPSSSDEGLSFFGVRNAVHYFTADGGSFATPSDAYIIVLDSHASSSQVSNTTVAPAIPYAMKITKTITVNTPSVTISGSIGNFFNVTGCDINFTASLDRRID
jgi:hypothetical protein